MDANIDLETEITPQMIEAGVIRLGELLQAGTGVSLYGFGGFSGNARCGRARAKRGPAKPTRRESEYQRLLTKVVVSAISSATRRNKSMGTSKLSSFIGLLDALLLNFINRVSG